MRTSRRMIQCCLLRPLHAVTCISTITHITSSLFTLSLIVPEEKRKTAVKYCYKKFWFWKALFHLYYSKKKKKRRRERTVKSLYYSVTRVRPASRILLMSSAEPAPAAIEMVVPVAARRWCVFIHCKALSSGWDGVVRPSANICWESRFFSLACKWWSRAWDRRPLISWSNVAVAFDAAAAASGVPVGRVRGLRPCRPVG